MNNPRISAIEQEFDEPLRDIVVVMRQQGCKWRTIAGALEVHPDTLFKWRVKYGFCLPSRKIARYEEPRGRKSPLNDIAKKYGYPSFTDLYIDWRITDKMLVGQVAKKLGLHPCTITRWTPPNLKGIWYFTDSKRKSAIENLKKARVASKANRSYPDW